jgi:hypothetical protein
MGGIKDLKTEPFLLTCRGQSTCIRLSPYINWENRMALVGDRQAAPIIRDGLRQILTRLDAGIFELEIRRVFQAMSWTVEPVDPKPRIVPPEPDLA